MKKVIPLMLSFVIFAAVCKAAPVDLSSIEVLDLHTAQRIALADNPSLGAAAERVEQALQRIAQARSLYLPRVDFDGGAGWSRISESIALNQQQGGISLDRNQERYQLSLAANWLIFDGFSRKYKNMIAQYGSEESEQARRDGQRILLQAVSEGYYTSHLSLYSTKIARADIAFNQQQLQEAEIRYEQGAGSLSSVLNFKVQINKAQTTLLTAERDYEIGLYGLAVLLGRQEASLPADIKLAELAMLEQNDFYSFVIKDLLSIAGQYRPDLLRQELRLQRSEAEIGEAKSPFYPTVGLLGSLNGERSEDYYLDEDDFGSTIGLSFSYNLYRGGGDEARVVESRAARREALRTLEQQKNQVKGEVRQAYANLQLAQKQLILQQSTTELVLQTRDLVRDGYNAGQESLVRLNEAQRDLVRTQSNLALALVGLYSTRYRLTTVTGESLQPFYPEAFK